MRVSSCSNGSASILECGPGKATFGAYYPRFGAECKGSAECTKQIIRRKSESVVQARQIGEREVENRARNVLRTNQPLERLVSSVILPVLALCPADVLEHIGPLRACKTHDNFAAICLESERRFILGVNGSRSFFDFAKAKDVIHDTAQAQPWQYFLLLCCCDLNKLAPYLDDDVDHSLGLGKSSDGLEDVAGIRHDADGLLWEVKLA